MLITITVTAILVISTLVWLVNRLLSLPVCPICAGVFLTWVGLLGAYNFGYQVDLTVPALLMGGSVVGIAYQLEKKLMNTPSGLILVFKMLFIPVGFVAAYSIIWQLWIVSIVAIILLIVLSLSFLSANNRAFVHNDATGSLERKMRDCC